MTVRLVLWFTFLFAGCPKAPEPPIDDALITWPPPPEAPRIKWIGHIATSDYAAPETGWRKVVEVLVGGPQWINFKKPYGITTDSQGRVFVSDTGWGRVLMFDKAGGQFAFWGMKGEGRLMKPSGLAVDRRDHLFVTDLELGRVFEYLPDGTFARTYGGGLLVRPSGVAVDADAGQLWVTDAERHTLELFQIDGAHVRTYGGRGPEDGQFNFPTNLVVGRDGEVYVVDTLNFRVQVFDRYGNFLRKWGRNCDGFGCFARPKGIAIDPDGHVYVVDAAFNNVQIFGPDGSLFLFFGGVGNGPGRMWLPAGIHIQPDGVVYVVSQYNWRVNMYQYVGGGEGAPVEAPAPPAPGAEAPPAGEDPVEPP